MISTRPAWSTGLPAIRKPMLVCGGSSVNPTRAQAFTTAIQPGFRSSILRFGQGNHRGHGESQRALRIRIKEPATPKDARPKELCDLSFLCASVENKSRPVLRLRISGSTGFFYQASSHDSACALVCQKCRRIELFAEAPSER